MFPGGSASYCRPKARVTFREVSTASAYSVPTSAASVKVADLPHHGYFGFPNERPGARDLFIRVA